MKCPASLPAALLLSACSLAPEARRTGEPDRTPPPASAAPVTAAAGRALEVRIRAEQLRNPYWYREHGGAEEARQFWDRADWERILTTVRDEGYNAVLYLPEPWIAHAWQTFLIRHREFPEARDLRPEEYDRVIEQVNWIFGRAHQLGLRNFLWSYFVVTTPSFARAHGMDRELPVSESVDYRHNLKDMGSHFGVRNELTRAFTEAAIAEVVQTYPELDGLCGGMGEALPGRRSAWFREAVVPGLRRSGRNPIFILDDWMLPFQDFLKDIAGQDLWPNTWLSLKPNGEVFTDPRPYPAALEWADEAGMPVLFQVMNLNIEAGFPFNSPRLAHRTIDEFRKIPNCIGYVSWFLDSNPNTLFRHALGHYGRAGERYSEAPWVDRLERVYGDREAARHFLRAFDLSGRIPGEVGAIAWLPQDIGHSQLLLLPYWHWSLEDPRWGYQISPSRGHLLPVRHYAQVVARHGDRFRDNDGSDFARNPEHPGAQELSWGLTRYPTTPEAHLRALRLLGEEAFAEAAAALTSVKSGGEAAKEVYHYLKAYQLLTAYYEKKVLAATSALIHGFGGGRQYRAEAERRADEAVELHRAAMEYLLEFIDRKRGVIRGRWGKTMSLEELIQHEAAERKRLAEIFGWPAG